MGVSSTWFAPRAWVDRPARDVVITAVDGRITEVREGAERPADATELPGLVVPGLANAHSHAFHRALRARVERAGGDFWGWREVMYAVAERLDPDRYHDLARATYAEMALAGITAVGEFHYLHHRPDGGRYDEANAMGAALVDAAAAAGVRLTLIDTCYLQGGADGAPLEGVQRRFSDGDADAWAARAADRPGGDHVRLAAGVHSVRAVPPDAIEVVAAWAGERDAPLHVHVSEQPAENEASLAATGRTPTGMLGERGALGPRTTAVHATHLTDEDVDTQVEALRERFGTLVDVLVGDLGVHDLRLEAVVRRQLEVGLDVDLGGELQARLVVHLGDLDLGLRQRLDLVLLQGLHVLRREDLVHRLVEDGPAADLPVDDGRRDLAAAEAGDVDLLGDLRVRRVEARLELLEGHLDGQLGPRGAQGLDGALHRCVSSCLMGVVRSGRQDSNLRSPAPKAGALATTLRPAKSVGPASPGARWSLGRSATDLLGADDGNRTRVASLEDWGSTIELHPHAPGFRPRGPGWRGWERRRSAGVIVPHGATPTPIEGAAADTRRHAQRRWTRSSARSSLRDPSVSISRSAPPSIPPVSNRSAWPRRRSMPSMMSRPGVSTRPSV
jgi:hypothetical protein